MGFCYDLYQAVRRVVFEPLFLLSGFTPKKYRLTQAEQEFVATNKRFWPAFSAPQEHPSVLVYGHMAGEGANYLLRLGMFSRAIAETVRGSVAVLLPRCGYNSQRNVLLFRSFGIRQFILLREMDWQFAARAKALWCALCWVLCARDVEDILQFSYKDIAFGDVLYNEIIHEVSGRHTIDKVRPYQLPFIFRFYLHLFVYEALLDQLAPRFLVTTHIQYTMFGTLARLALARGIVVVETTDMSTCVFNKQHLQNGVDYFSYVHDQIVRQLEDAARVPALIATAEKELSARMQGTLKQMDAQLAYGNKKNVEDAELRASLGETRGRPLVTICAHVFSDTPAECSRRTLYRDYFVWLVETLRIVAKIDSVHWILKPHPAQRRYGEYEHIVQVFEEAQKQATSNNLSWCPEELSTNSLITLSRAIVTCQGTVGLESSCVGVPAIIAGAPFYRGFGFVYEPRTIQEYAELLRCAGELAPLTHEQMQTAKAVYGAFSKTTTAHENELIDPELLNHVWGYRSAANSDAAYRMLIANLRDKSPREQELFHRGERIARGEFW